MKNLQTAASNSNECLMAQAKLNMEAAETSSHLTGVLFADDIEEPQLTREHLIQLLQLEDFTPVYELADKVRRETVGDEVHIRAIIEFSNICARQCKYCGLNCNHEGVDYYPVSYTHLTLPTMAVV